jgi:hypothetical protein
MTADELIELLEERPFVPLRLHLSDGQVREIRHPDMAIVSETLVAIGVPRGDNPRLATKITRCSLSHVVSIEPMIA